jgi:hypothetical protein
MALGIIAAVTAPIPILNFISAGVAFVALVLGCFGLASDHRRNGTGKASKALIILTSVTMVAIYAWDSWLADAYQETMARNSAYVEPPPIPALPFTGKIHKMAIDGDTGYTLSSVMCSTEIPSVYGPEDLQDLKNQVNPMIENQPKPQFCQVTFKVTNLSPANVQYPRIPLDYIQALGVVGQTTYGDWDPSAHKASVPPETIGISESAVIDRWVQISVGQKLDGIEFHSDIRLQKGVGIGIKILPMPRIMVTRTRS